MTSYAFFLNSAPNLERLSSTCVAFSILPRLVMSSLSRPTSSSSTAPSPLLEPPSSSSSSSSSSASSYTKILSVGAIETIVPQGEEVRGDDPGNATNQSSTSEWLRPHEGPSWVDPKVFGITSVFLTDVSVSDFLKRVPIVKASAREYLLTFDSCSLTDRVYKERSSTEPHFFFMYTCLFSDLHVSLPFDTFTVGVLQALNVALSQLHPNTWASMQVFRVVCQIFGLRPSSSCFCISTPPTRLTLSVGIRWSAGRATFCSKPSRPHIKTSKRGSLKCLWSPRVCHTSLMQLVSLDFLCFGLGSLQRLRIDLVRLN